MTTRRIKTSVVAAIMFSVLAGSTTRAEQGAAPGDLETLKRMMQQVVSENQELRMRVQQLEAAITRLQAGIGKQEQSAQEATKETAKEPTRAAATNAAEGPAKEPTRAAAKEPAKEAKGLWEKIQLGGAIEVDALRSTNFADVSRSDLKLSTAEFDIEANLVDWAKATLVISFDGDADKLTLDSALITLGEKRPISLKAGRGTLPFGLSTGTTVAAKLEDTLTLTDPLTLVVFDAEEDYVSLGVTTGGFNAGAYVFDGRTNRRRGGDKRLEHYGATVGYGMKTDIMAFTAGVSMIDSVFDSDGLTEAFPEALTSRYVPGVAAHLRFGLGGFSLVTTYYGALERARFNREKGERVRTFRIQPKAWHVEGGYTTDIFSKKTYIALGYSETEELAGAFPERRKIATIGRWLLDNVLLAFDYAYDEDYARAFDGTGRSADAFTLRLTYEW